MESTVRSAVDQLETAARKGNVNDTLTAISEQAVSSSQDSSRKFLDDVTTELHRRGTLPSVVRSYVQSNFQKCDLNGDGRVAVEELTKLLEQPIYARSQTNAERQLLAYMKANFKEISKSSNDDWWSEKGISLKDATAFADARGAKFRKDPGKYAAETPQKAPFSDIPTATRSADSSESFLPNLMLEVGRKNFGALDQNNNGFVERDEIDRLAGNPSLAKTFTEDEHRALTEMSAKVEQIQRSNRDEWWYKDVKGITLKDLVAYADHQTKNMEKFPTTPGDHEVMLTIGGVQRKTNIHIPPGYDGSKPLPVVYAFHYFRGNAEKMAEYSKLNEKADAEKFIIVYPNAVGWVKDFLPQWNLNNKPSFRVDEMAYVGQLMDKIDRDLNVDKTRVYVAGYSNGGMLAHEVASKFSNRIAAFASVSGCQTGKLERPAMPVPALMIHGTGDKVVPYEGRMLTPLFPRFQPLSQSANFWKSVNRTLDSKVEEPVDGVKKETFRSADKENAVVVYTLKGNGHGWPGSPISIDGNACTKVQGADLVWDFFKKHQR